MKRLDATYRVFMLINRITVILAVLLLAGSALGFMTLIQRRRAPAVSAGVDMNLVMWLEFADATACSNGYYQDSSTYGNDGTQSVANSRATWTNDSGSALIFDGADDYIAVGDSDSLDFGTGEFTLSVWINASSWTHAGQHNTIMCKQNPENAGEWVFQVLGTPDSADIGKLSFRVAAANVFLTSSNTPATWDHVVVARSGTTVTAYKDGQLRAIGTNSTSLSNANELRIGFRNVGYPARFKGSIGEVRIYNRGLASNEVNTLYTDGR